MALKQFQKSSLGDSTSLANVGTENEGILRRAGLFKIDITGRIQTEDAEGIFLLNPSSLQESKSSNWVEHNVPGQSDPVFQWVSSGARTVTFEALVTADTSDFAVASTVKETKKAKPKNVVDAVASFALKLFKVQVPPPRSTEPLKNTEVLDISDYLNYYRSLLYPEYSNPSNKGPQTLKSSPPLLVLMMGNTVSNLAFGSRITNKHDVWVLKDLQIRVTKQLPNLAPMEALVTFTLVQYNIRSSDSSKFYPRRG